MGTINIGGTSYEVYGDAAGITAYMAAALHSAAWDDASAANRDRAHVTATRMLDRAPWQGQKTADGQPLEWPRTGVTDRYGEAVDDGTVPEQIITATYELTLALLVDAEVQTAPFAGSNVRSERSRQKVGSLETEAQTDYFVPTLRSFGRFPTIVQELVREFLESAGAIVGPKSSGTDVESSFGSGGELDDFGHSGGGLP